MSAYCDPQKVKVLPASMHVYLNGMQPMMVKPAAREHARLARKENLEMYTRYFVCVQESKN